MAVFVAGLVAWAVLLVFAPPLWAVVVPLVVGLLAIVKRCYEPAPLSAVLSRE